MSLYNIIDRSKQAQVRPAYRLKNLREKHARFSNHVTFLSRCHGIIPTELRITPPVKSAKADRIAHRAGQALVRERIADARCQKQLASIHIADLQSNLSQSLTTKKWTWLDRYCEGAADTVHLSTKQRQIGKFEQLKSRVSTTTLLKMVAPASWASVASTFGNGCTSRSTLSFNWR